MIARFQHGVEGVAMLDQVTTPATIANVDAGADAIVDRAMPHGDAGGHADFDSRRLFLDSPDAGDEAVLDEAICWVVVILRTYVRRIDC